MNLADKIIEYIADKALGNDTLRYADLATCIGLLNEDRQIHPEIKNPYILTTEKNEFVSVIRVQGCISAFGEASFSEYIHRLSIGVTQLYSHKGHKISVFFDRDKNKNSRELNRLYRPHIAAMKRLSINLSPIIRDEALKLSSHYVNESCYVVLYSSLDLLGKEDISADKKNIDDQLAGILKTAGQNPVYQSFSGLKILHDSVLWQCVSSLKGNDSNGMILNVLDVEEIGYLSKSFMMPKSTPENWRPVTPFNQVNCYDRQTGVTEDDLFPVKLKQQILSGKINHHNDIIECDGVFYKSFYLDEMPLNKIKFQNLFKELNKNIPLRVKFDLIGGFSNNTHDMVLSVLRFIPSLQPIAQSMDYIKEADKTDKVIRFAVSFMTWGNSEQEVSRYYSMLSKTIQSWGVTTVSDTLSNPVATFISAVPALANKTTGTVAYAPLSEALYMLPFERPASIWHDDGIVFYLTEDGKLFPYRLASDKQAKHTEVITGTSGSGKSVVANKNNLSVIFLGQQNLPFMTIIDKGLSAKGIYDLIVHELPADKKHFISHIVLENSPAHRINFLETQLGSRFLVDHEKLFVVQMLCAFCIDSETGTPPNSSDIYALFNKLVDVVYENLSHRNAKSYEPVSAEITAALNNSGALAEKPDGWLDSASWFDVEDLLFDKGCHLEAALAHRQAMPVLVDIAGYLSDSSIESAYCDVNVKGSQESLLHYVQRNINSAITSYPILSNITNYDYNAETRIAIIDMMKVLGAKNKAGQLQSGIMYLFARHVATKNYYLPQFAETFIDSLHPRYREYHQTRIDILSEETKHTFYDECHNFKDISFIQNALNTADLEDRKFGIRTVFCSQYIQHMPESVITSVNTLFMMRLADGDEEYLRKLGITIPDDVIRRFKRISTGIAPDGSGTYFLAVFKTDEGNLCHILKNTMGSTQLWALTSNNKDRKLRELLYKKVGVKDTLEILTKEFPTSTAVHRIKTMMDSFDMDDNEDNDMTAVEKLAQELTEKYGIKE